MTPEQLRETAEFLLDIARRVGPEGEGMEIDDPLTMEEVVALRSHLSATRRAVDVVNKSLAQLWTREFGISNRHDDGANEWYVAERKGKVIINDDMFYAWLATKDADELAKLVSASSIKVGGMSPVERETHLDERPTDNTLSIQSRPKR